MANAKGPRSKRKLLSRIKWRSVINWLLIIGLLSFLGISSYVAATLPAFDPQQLTGANSTLLYDEDGKVFSSLHAGENRTEVTLEKVPPVLIQAFVATEDKEFYNHHGVNYKGIARAVLRNFQARDMTGQGASTITQQLARSAFLTADKNYLRKLKEVVMAYRIEFSYSKEEILEMYLNKIYFGAGAYGVQAASNTYFGKDVSQLTLPESALLAGLVQSPNNYNPFIDLDKAKARQKQVLNAMADSGFINEASAAQAYDVQLQLAKSQSSNTQYGFYVDAVIDEAAQILSGVKGYEEDGDSAVYKSGLNIYTTINAPLQAYAEEYFKNSANFPANNKAGQPAQAGMAIVENASGEIKAIMGGRQYLQQRGFNRATNAYRQPGSAIKPLTVYSPALEQGLMPFNVLNDSRISYKTSSGTWSPENYDNNYRGLITMRTAVQYSVNTIAVQTEEKVGVRNGFDMGNALGLDLVDTPGTNDLNLASMALGGLTKGVTPVQMATAYASLGNTGIYNSPHFISKIVDSRGVIIYQYKPNAKRVMTEQTSWLMNNMLQTVVTSGTGTNARIANVPTAGKTGTSEDMTDIWFCGITPVYSGAVWMGYDDQKYKMVNVYGGGLPAQMWRSMMQKAHQGIKAGSWPMPGSIVQVQVCNKSGKLHSDSCPADSIITEFCVKGYEPTETCPGHQNVVLCKQTGKLATRSCPETEAKTFLIGTNNIPTETCDAHPGFSLPGLLKNTVKICTDPRHNGQLYRANIAGLFQKGGCPDKYISEIVLPSGETLPLCPLENHQIK
ncbi:MAG: transglycosylase domain-containing protein [Syntrophomonadaceae bacterium]|nr:transglycosylase domain-containing protein [Syntrophomonadaceae bacterium]